MKITGNFEVDISAQEMCEVLGTVTPEESKAFREKLMTDDKFAGQLANRSIQQMFASGSDMLSIFLDKVNK